MVLWNAANLWKQSKMVVYSGQESFGEWRVTVDDSGLSQGDKKHSGIRYQSSIPHNVINML